MFTSLSTLGVVGLLSSGLMGLVFLVSGLIKSVDPNVFMQHLHQQGWVPSKQLRAATTLLAGLECALGAALLLQVFPHVLLPITLLLLLALTSLTYWSTTSGRTEDCGCYGGLVAITPTQSMLLNGLYALLIAFAWMILEVEDTAAWQVGVAVAAGAIGSVLAEVSRSYQLKHGKKLFMQSPLEPARAFRQRWSGGRSAPDVMQGEVLVAYLGLECPHCHRWVSVLNLIHRVDGLPRVVGVIAGSAEDRKAFELEHAVRFPLAMLPRAYMNRLAPAVPTTLLIQNGNIQEKWVGHMSADFVERFKKAIFPSLATSASNIKSTLQ
ncbi:MAG TPA: MauE/DoxX family redox-associated membrane protein [Rhodothermales bacterium]|nr:MauE/DoxX family redox-associated membrane protein [Rhodothermales bacterium]